MLMLLKELYQLININPQKISLVESKEDVIKIEENIKEKWIYEYFKTISTK